MLDEEETKTIDYKPSIKVKKQFFEHGAHFEYFSLFKSLLDLIPTMPIDRLGNKGVYFQDEQPNPSTKVGPNKKSLKKFYTIKPLPPLSTSITFSPKKRSRLPGTYLKTEDNQGEIMKKRILRTDNFKVKQNTILPLLVFRSSTIGKKKKPIIKLTRNATPLKANIYKCKTINHLNLLKNIYYNDLYFSVNERKK